MILLQGEDNETPKCACAPFKVLRVTYQDLKKYVKPILSCAFLTPATLRFSDLKIKYISYSNSISRHPCCYLFFDVHYLPPASILVSCLIFAARTALPVAPHPENSGKLPTILITAYPEMAI
jgi:hypothetical protein